MSSERSRDRDRSTISGYPVVAVAVVAIAAGLWVAGQAARRTAPPSWAVGAGVVIAVAALLLAGLYMIQPNQSAVLMLFGRYEGTDRSNGLRWANPFYRKSRVSLRAHNFVSDRIKVNDARGNPIEIAAAVVWRVRDAAQALFDVEDYEAYVLVQAETAIRHLASSYPYDEGITDV